MRAVARLPRASAERERQGSHLPSSPLAMQRVGCPGVPTAAGAVARSARILKARCRPARGEAPGERGAHDSSWVGTAADEIAASEAVSHSVLREKNLRWEKDSSAKDCLGALVHCLPGRPVGVAYS